MKPIKFHFQPFKIEDKLHVAEKSVDGTKRRYLKGIASGMRVDAHGERLTPNCIKDIQSQAMSGDILLYPDVHGIRGTDDIGILENSEISPDGDWIIEPRLYDLVDNVGSNTLERVDKLWRQLNGYPPYTTPKQKGFSIEGYIPDEGILEMSDDGRRVIDKVILDGVVVVPRPAYTTSIANAIYKALGEVPPGQLEKVKNIFKSLATTEELTNNYFKKKFHFQDVLENEIERVMNTLSLPDKPTVLKSLFEGYQETMIDLILKSKGVFINDIIDNKQDKKQDKKTPIIVKNKLAVLKSLSIEVDKLLQKFN